MKHLTTPQYVAFSYVVPKLARFAPTVRVKGVPIEESQALVDNDAVQKGIYKQPNTYLGHKDRLKTERLNPDMPEADKLTPAVRERMRLTTIAEKAKARKAAFPPRGEVGEALDKLSFKPSVGRAAGLESQRLRGLLGNRIQPTQEDIPFLQGIAENYKTLQTNVGQNSRNLGKLTPHDRLQKRADRIYGLIGDIEAGKEFDINPVQADPSKTTPFVGEPKVTTPATTVNDVPVDEFIPVAPNTVASADGPRIQDLVPGPVKNAGAAVYNSAGDAINYGKGLLGAAPDKALVGGLGLLGAGAAVLGGNALANGAAEREAYRQQQLQAVRDIGVY